MWEVHIKVSKHRLKIRTLGYITLALRKAVISVRTLVTVGALILWFARTLSSSYFTDIPFCTIHITCARETKRIVVVSFVTPTINDNPYFFILMGSETFFKRFWEIDKSDLKIASLTNLPVAVATSKLLYICTCQTLLRTPQLSMFHHICILHKVKF